MPKLFIMNLNTRSILFAFVLVITTTIVKFVCAPVLGLSGFTTIIAVALFGGMSTKDKNASFLLPLIALLVSDVIIEMLYQLNLFAFKGFYKHQFLNYGLLLITTLIGWSIKGKKAISVLAASFIAPTVFFLLSNFSVWFFSTTMYTKDFSGLMLCYEMGLPFYRNAIVSTMLFVPAIIFTYNVIMNRKKNIVLV